MRFKAAAAGASDAGTLWSLVASVGVWSPRYVAVSMDRTVVEVDGRFSRGRLRATTAMPNVEHEPVRDCVFEYLKISSPPRRANHGGPNT